MVRALKERLVAIDNTFTYNIVNAIQRCNIRGLVSYTSGVRSSASRKGSLKQGVLRHKSAIE